MKINKKIYLIIGLLIILLLTIVYLAKRDCHDKEYKIHLTLLSGEEGIINLTNNQCKFNDQKVRDLSFKLLSDGGLEESIYHSRLYFWLRNNKSPEEQILSLAKDKTCQVVKNQYSQHDGLETYSLKGDNCYLFGQITDFSSEVYMVVNNLLIAQRQDGFDGIKPFNLASIRFINQ